MTSWKESLKEWGSVAWAVLGILMAVLMVIGMICLSMFSSAQAQIRGHFKEKHGVVCDCK
jgi:hypothetical protein